MLSFGSTEPLTLQEQGGGRGHDHRFKRQYLCVCVCELNANIQTNLAETKKKGTEEVSFTHFIIFSYKKKDKPTASNISYRKWKAKNSSTILESLSSIKAKTSGTFLFLRNSQARVAVHVTYPLWYVPDALSSLWNNFLNFQIIKNLM